MNVHDAMICDVISVRVDIAVDEIAKALNEHRIGGVPVVDNERRVIGIGCESDPFIREKGLPFSVVKIPTLFKRWVDPDRLAEIYEGARHHTAADVMTTNMVCVDVDDAVGHAALLMAQRNIKRIPVLRDGRLVGIITRTDIIRLLAREEK